MRLRLRPSKYNARWPWASGYIHTSQSKQQFAYLASKLPVPVLSIWVPRWHGARELILFYVTHGGPGSGGSAATYPKGIVGLASSNANILARHLLKGGGGSMIDVEYLGDQMASTLNVRMITRYRFLALEHGSDPRTVLGETLDIDYRQMRILYHRGRVRELKKGAAASELLLGAEHVK